MSDLPRITESLPDLQHRLHRERDPLGKQRLHLLVLLKEGAAASQAEAACHLALHRNTVSRYLQRYREVDLGALLEVGSAGRPAGQRLLPPKVFEVLGKRLDADGFASYKEAQLWLEQTYDLHLGYKSLHKLIRYRLGAKLKRSRPRHPKGMSPKPLSS